jgi:hypothetical protein
MLDAGGIEDMAADRTGGSEDQWQKNNLVEKRGTVASPPLGTVSTGDFGACHRPCSDDSSTGTNSIPNV